MALFDEEAVSAFGHILEVPIWDLHKIVEESSLVENVERPLWKSIVLPVSSIHLA